MLIMQGKDVTRRNNNFVRCSKCSMILKAQEAIDMYSATLEVKDTTSGQKLESYAFKEHLSTIANSSEFIEFDLLEAETFSFNAKHDHTCGERTINFQIELNSV